MASSEGVRSVVGDALIVVVGDEIEDVFFKIGAGAGDAVNLVLADHFGEGEAELRGAHGAADGDKHFAAVGEMNVIGFRGVDEGSGIEMTIVVFDKRGN